MENSIDSLKLGKSVTQHILMQNLLGVTRRNKTAGTQTESDYCFCGCLIKPSSTRIPIPILPIRPVNQVKKQIRKFNKILPPNDYNKSKDIMNLMQSIKQRMQIEEQSVDSNSEDENTWSDSQSLCTECEINFPKETKHAMKMLQGGRPAPPPAPPLNRLYSDGDSVRSKRRNCSSARSYPK